MIGISEHAWIELYCETLGTHWVSVKDVKVGDIVHGGLDTIVLIWMVEVSSDDVVYMVGGASTQLPRWTGEQFITIPAVSDTMAQPGERLYMFQLEQNSTFVRVRLMDEEVPQQVATIAVPPVFPKEQFPQWCAYLEKCALHQIIWDIYNQGMDSCS